MLYRLLGIRLRGFLGDTLYQRLDVRLGVPLTAISRPSGLHRACGKKVRDVSSAIDRPNVSVVVSTYHRVRVLPHAPGSLLDQDHDPARYEIVAVDNNSTDGTCRTRWPKSFFSGGSLGTTPAA